MQQTLSMKQTLTIQHTLTLQQTLLITDYKMNTDNTTNTEHAARTYMIVVGTAIKTNIVASHHFFFSEQLFCVVSTFKLESLLTGAVIRTIKIVMNGA